MSSWRYAYFFSNPGRSKMEPQAAIGLLLEYGFEFDNVISFYKEVDEDGHLEAVGDQVNLKDPVKDSLYELIYGNEQFLAECRNKEIFLTCRFALGYRNPHFVLGWSNKIVSRLRQDFKQFHDNMILSIAKDSNSEYVIFVNDPPDYFEDRFLVIDDIPFLETSTSLGTPYELIEIWARKDAPTLNNIEMSGVKVKIFDRD